MALGIENMQAGFCEGFTRQTQEHFASCTHCRHTLKTIYHSLPPMIRMFIDKDTRTSIENMVDTVSALPTGTDIQPTSKG